MTSFRIRSGLVLFLLPILNAPALAEEPSEDTHTAFLEHMHSHLEQISDIKDAVIAGNLPDVREPARWLAASEPPGLSLPWMPYVQEMRRYASRAADATDLVAAASADLPAGSAKELDIEHPSGRATVRLILDAGGVVESAAILRTARKLFDGTVFAR